MQAGQITAPNRIQLIEIEPPGRPAEGEVIVAVETACLCGSDIAYFSEPQAAYPLPLGLSLHEMIGTVTASASPHFKPGDRVMPLPPGLRGLFEHLVIADDRVVAVGNPEDAGALPNAVAVLAQPLATVLSALTTVPNVVGALVVVVGQGPMGQLLNAALASMGAARIVGVDRLPRRLDVSLALGATDVVDASEIDPVEAVREMTGGRMADLVVEAVGHREQAFDLAVALCRDRGRMLYFGVPPEGPMAVDWHRVFRKSLTIHASTPSDLRPFVRTALQWIRERRVEPQQLVTHRFAVHDIQRAYECYRDRVDGAMKVLVDVGPVNPAAPAARDRTASETTIV
jgi:threonine dehydrogenase-like Zn-dependent dehydrogenase